MATRLIQLTDLPVSLEEAKLHLRVDNTEEDDLIVSLIEAAAMSATNKANRSFGLTVWEKRLDAFPEAEIRLPYSPVVKVSSVKYKDADGDQQTLAAENFKLAAADDNASIAPVVEWPEGATDIRVQYLAGYTIGIPSPVRQWMMLHVGHWYRNREAASEKTLVPVPFGDSLIYPYKIWGV